MLIYYTFICINIAPLSGKVCKSYAKECNVIVTRRSSVLQRVCINPSYRGVLKTIFSLYDKNLAEEHSEKTPVHFAAEHCDEELLKFLIEKQCNVNLKDAKKNSPLFTCIMNSINTKKDSKKVFLELLVKAGCNLKSKDKVSSIYFNKFSSSLLNYFYVKKGWEECV